MRTDELEDGKEEMEAVLVLPPEVPQRHLSARSLASYQLPRRVHEQLPIASSFCSPTPALSITLAAHSALPVVQCMPTTSRATFSSGHGKSSAKSATSSLITISSRPPFSLSQNQSRCARHNWVRSSSFHPCTPPCKGRSR